MFRGGTVGSLIPFMRRKRRYRWPVPGDFVVWYGNAYGWHRNDHDAAAAALRFRGLAGGIIELAAGFESDVDGYANPHLVEQPFRDMVKAYRRHDLTLLVVVTNANVRFTKWGNHARSLAQVVDHCDWLQHLVLDQGPEGLIVQPVAEAGEEWIDYERQWGAVFKSRGFFTAYNAHSRPVPPPPADFDLVVHHANDLSGSFPSGVAEVSDNGGSRALRWLQGGMYSPGIPDRLRHMIRSARASGCPACGYYQAFHMPWDPHAVRACGEALLQ